MNATVKFVLKKLFMGLIIFFIISFFLKLDSIILEMQGKTHKPRSVTIASQSESEDMALKTDRMEQSDSSNTLTILKANTTDHLDKSPNTTKPLFLLTLFTTFREESQRPLVYNLTLYNWVTLGDDVQLVLFVPQDSQAHSNYWRVAVQEPRWHLRMVPKMNRYGTPVINSMFRDVYEHYNSYFYGYASGDILFSDDLLQTLQAVRLSMGDTSTIKPAPFVVGQRRSMSVEPKDCDKDANFWMKSSVHNNQKKLRSDNECSLDYLIITKDFPWASLPDLAVGRPYWATYLLMMAMYHNLTTIDATRTLGPLHLIGTGSSNEDQAINLFNMERYGSVPYQEACTPNCQYQTVNAKGNVRLKTNKRLVHRGSSLTSQSQEMVRQQLYNFQHNITHNLTEVPQLFKDLNIDKINF